MFLHPLSQTRQCTEPFPFMDGCIDFLGKFALFKTLEGNSWYREVAMQTGDRDMTALTSHYTLSQFMRMLFMSNRAPSSLQQRVDVALSAVMWQFSLLFLGDIILLFRSTANDIDHVTHVFTLLRDARATLKSTK